MKDQIIAAIVIAVAATSGVTGQETRRQGNASRTPQRSKYLETGGERKLEVIYKNIADRDLTLDLYYPTAGRSKKCPVIVFTHGGGSSNEPSISLWTIFAINDPAWEMVLLTSNERIKRTQ